MRHEQARNDERDNRRAFRWGITAAIVILLLAIGFNLMSRSRNDSGPSGSQGITQPAPDPAPGSVSGGGPTGAGGVTGNGGGGGHGQTGQQ